MPRDRIEYNSGKAAVSQDPSTTPLVDLSPEEVIKKIETAGAWMVLKDRLEFTRPTRHCSTRPCSRSPAPRVLRATPMPVSRTFRGSCSSPRPARPPRSTSTARTISSSRSMAQEPQYLRQPGSLDRHRRSDRHAITKHRNIKFEERCRDQRACRITCARRRRVVPYCGRIRSPTSLFDFGAITGRPRR